MSSTTLHTIDTGHEDMIHDSAFDHYGKFLATCSSDKRIRIFDVSGDVHVPVAEILKHNAAVWRLSWAHPKFGALLASCSYDTSVIIHQEVGKGSWAVLHLSKDHKSSVNDVEFCPHEHGLAVASCSSDGDLRVLRREADGWRSQSIGPSCSLGLNALSWAPFAHVGSVGADRQAVQRLATAACDGKVRVYRKAGAGRAAGAGAGEGAGASTDAGSGSTTAGESPSWELEWVLDHERRVCLGGGAGAGAGAASGAGDSWAGAVDSESQLDALRGGALWIRDASFCPSSGVPTNLLASCADDGSVLVWQQDAPGKPWAMSVLRAGSEAGPPAWGVSWSLAGGVLAVTSGDGEVSLWKKPVAGAWEQVTASGTPVGPGAAGGADVGAGTSHKGADTSIGAGGGSPAESAAATQSLPALPVNTGILLVVLWKRRRAQENEEGLLTAEKPWLPKRPVWVTLDPIHGSRPSSQGLRVVVLYNGCAVSRTTAIRCHYSRKYAILYFHDTNSDLCASATRADHNSIRSTMAAVPVQNAREKSAGSSGILCPPDPDITNAAYPDVVSLSLDVGDLSVGVLTNSAKPREGGYGYLLVHGNLSSKEMYRQAVQLLGDAGVYAAAIDLRGFGTTEPSKAGTELKPIDAANGLADWANQVEATASAVVACTPGLSRLIYVGWSLGGTVLMRRLRDNAQAGSNSSTDPGARAMVTSGSEDATIHAAAASSGSSIMAGVVLLCPGSPSGYGGSMGTTGFQACHTDGAGSGAGNANPAVVAALAGKDLGDGPFTARGLLRGLYVADPARIQGGPGSEREEAFVASILQTRLGDGFYPGTSVPSKHWPMNAPGASGILNALAPQHCRPLWDLARKAEREEEEDARADADDGRVGNGGRDDGEDSRGKEREDNSLAAVPPVPILWIRGGKDKIVADGAALDMAVLGAAGIVPGWPGVDVMPPQMMVSQTRSWLEGYSAKSGTACEEVEMADCGHGPCIEDPEGFVEHLLHFRETIISKE